MRPSPRIRAKDHIIKARDPELAPRCPQCGYNLYGNAELRCPECGHRASFDEAHWASDACRLDRSAVLRERIYGGLGWLLIAGGVVFWVLEVRQGKGLSAFFAFRAGAISLVAVWAFLHALREEGEPRGKLLLVLGVLWLLISVASWFFG